MKILSFEQLQKILDIINTNTTLDHFKATDRMITNYESNAKKTIIWNYKSLRGGTATLIAMNLNRAKHLKLI